MVMETDAEEALARLLVAARSTRTLIEAVPPDLVPADAASAYRTAQRVAEATGEVRGGWKIGATAVDNLHELGAAEPIYGRIPKHAILESPCRIPFDALMTRSEEHTTELQSLMSISYAVFGLKKKKNTNAK